ncbi:MAG: adenylosuccinate lyase family protein [Rhodobacteraceae bacterium]|nr:adenylosuccinate lyase family protein [Paracoccaceae bacterium]
MAGSVFDSPLYAALFPTGEVGRLFTDSAAIRAMLLVEGALAKAQGEQGVIPANSGNAIHRASLEVQIEPGALAQATGVNGVAVPALVAAFRNEMQAPEHAQYVHWGATSQDIIDTGLMLRLRQSLVLIEADMRAAIADLGTLAQTHADLPMVARTYGQDATPTSFGGVVAEWGAPLAGLLNELGGLRNNCLLVSLSGASGTSAALGPDAALTRAALARALGLGDPGRSWHNDRTAILRLADWLTRATLAFGKLGEDLIALTANGVGEVTFANRGASSTMPQKQNPVAPSALVALARQSVGLNSALQGSSVHQFQRDGAAWFGEWMCLPQIVLGAASSAKIGREACGVISPVPDRMATALETGLDMIHAEALSFALAAQMRRPEAQAVVKELCREAQESNMRLRDLVRRDWPGVDPELFDVRHRMGDAPKAARGFAAQAAALESDRE